MASLGKVRVADLAPNHPWAHTQISFGQKQTGNESNSSPTTSQESSISPVQAVENLITKMHQEVQQSLSEQPTSPENSEKPSTDDSSVTE